jgi:hypothetical protein
MENSSSYLALEGMLQQGWVFMSFAELERVLYLLEKKGLVTCAEHQALTELARKLGMDKLPEA